MHRRALTRLHSVRSTPNKKRSSPSGATAPSAVPSLQCVDASPGMKEVVAFWSNRALCRAFPQFQKHLPKLPSADAFWSSHSLSRAMLQMKRMAPATITARLLERPCDQPCYDSIQGEQTPIYPSNVRRLLDQSGTQPRLQPPGLQEGGRTAI